jgi:hypothetical protein
MRLLKTFGVIVQLADFRPGLTQHLGQLLNPN